MFHYMDRIVFFKGFGWVLIGYFCLVSWVCLCVLGRVLKIGLKFKVFRVERV